MDQFSHYDIRFNQGVTEKTHKCLYGRLCQDSNT